MSRNVHLFIFFFALNITQVGFSKNLPKDILTPNEHLETIRRNLTNKFTDLHNNYIKNETPHYLKYTSHKMTFCKRKRFTPGEILTSINYNKKEFPSKKGKKTIETISYFDCGEELNLQEVIVTVGPGSSLQNLKDLKVGKIKFSLGKKETSKSYMLLNGKGRELFQIILYRKNKMVFASYSIRESIFMTTQMKEEKENLFFGHSFHPYEYSYNYGSDGWRSRSSGLTSSIDYFKNKKSEYFLRSGEKLPLKVFRELYLNKVSSIMKDIAAFLNSHLQMFPPTKVLGSSSGKDKKIINEIKISLSQLQNNNTQAVIKYLTDLLKDIEKGSVTIDDRRK